MKKLGILAAGLAVAFAVSCGGGSEAESVLHLRDHDATEAQVRTYLRLEFSAVACDPLRGLSAQDIIDIAEASEDSADENNTWLAYAERVDLPWTGNKKADDRSAFRVAELVIEECDRLRQ